MVLLYILMTSKIRPLKFGLKYSPPSIILEYQLGEKKRRRVMPVRNLNPESDVHDIVDKLIDAHSQLDPGIVPTEQVVRLVQKLIDNTKPAPSPIKTTPRSNPLAPLAPLKASTPFSSLSEPKILNKDANINGNTNGKDKDIMDNKKELKDNKDTKPQEKEKDIKATQDIKEPTKPIQDNKPKEEPIKAPAPSRPVLGSLPGLSKLGGLPSLSQPLSKPAPSASPFKHALDSDEEDDDLLGNGLDDDDDLDDLLDEDKLRRSLDLESDNDIDLKHDARDQKKQPAKDLIHSDEDSYHSDEYHSDKYHSDEDDQPVYNKPAATKTTAAPVQKKPFALDSPRSGSDSENEVKRDGLDSDDDLYDDDILEEVEEERDYHSSEGEGSEEDLNKLDDNELNRRKAQMNISFEQNRKLPGEPGFKYDIQKNFASSKASEWDQDEVDDDF